MHTLLPCEVRECALAGVQCASVNWYSCIMPWHFVGCSTHTHKIDLHLHWCYPHSRHGRPAHQLTHAGAFNTLDEASRIRGNCRWHSNGTAPHAGWAILHFWFPCSTHTHTHARTDAHAHMHHAGTLYGSGSGSSSGCVTWNIRVIAAIKTCVYSALLIAFRLLGAKSRNRNRNISDTFSVAMILRFSSSSLHSFSAFKQAAGKQFFSALWSAIRAAHAVRVKRAVNIARHRLLNALESWKKKKKVEINVASCNPNGAALKMQHAQCCPSWGWQQELLHGRNMHDLRFGTAWVARKRSKVIALTAPHRVDAYSRIHVFRAEKCHLSWWGNINGNGNSGGESKRNKPES